jgi:hypothetical protein
MRFPAITMIRPVRMWLLALLAGASFAAVAAPAQAAPEFRVESFFAGNCNAASKAETTGCKHAATPAEEKANAEVEGYTQAAGHPAFGVTDFTVNSHVIQEEPFVAVAPNGIVTHVRTDVGPGVSTNPEAVAKCSFEEFGVEIPKTGVFFAPECSASSVIGVNKIVVLAEPKKGLFADVPLEGKVYNLVQPSGLASDFGVAIPLPKETTEPLFKTPEQLYSHTLIEGSVEWAGNYHDYYEINVSPTLPLISSRLILKGDIGNTGKGGFITNPSNCAGPGAATLNTVMLTSAEGQKASREYIAPLGTEGCMGENHLTIPPFAPALLLTPETTQSDQPDGLTTELTLPHDPSPTGIDSSQLRDATVTLPEGMTLNPAAAYGMEACTPKQIGIGTRNEVECPAGSKIGTVTLDVPDLPPGALKGDLYLGGPESGPITGPPYTMYIDASSSRYGVSVRLKGTVVPNETTGRLTASFVENPQQPFSDVVLHFKGGPLAPLANPLVCGVASAETSLVPYIGAFATQTPFSSLLVDSNGSGGACPSPLPFSLGQSTQSLPATGGASSSYTFTLTRPTGQQYLSQVKTVLPAGLVGRIPAVALCSETQVAEASTNAEACPASSRIGSVTVAAGAGSAPYTFGGSVYLTGPYGSAPYGMAIVVPAVAGPFNLGNVVTRASINVEPYSPYRVVVTSAIPTIVKGVPLRLQRVSIEVNRQSFLLNPTNCAALATDSTLTGFAVLGSTTTTTQSLSTPFQAEECSKLAFKPSLTAFTGANTSKANGASLEVKLSQGSGQANVQKVITTLPKQLVSRLTTLQKACPAATFEVNPPGACPAGSRVGSATATTPVLPGTLTGSVYFVSHGGAAFPDLDVILRGDGVTTILVGHTNIAKGLTTTTFESLPDVPVSSFALTLPTAANSALTANGNVCTANLVMPTTIVAQNGAKITQNTKISPTNCPVLIVAHRTSGNTARLTVQLPAAGRISGSGPDLQTVTRHLGNGGRTTLNVSLTRVGREVLSKFRQLRIKVRVGFVPKTGRKTSKAYATVTYRA